MPVKNNLNDTQIAIKQVLDDLRSFNAQVHDKYISKSIDNIINTYTKLYKLDPECLTLREYLNKNSFGAYHHFVFWIRNVQFDVIGVDDFEYYHNSSLLDKFMVVDDVTTDNNGNCENYQATHKLTLKPIGKK